MLLKKKVRRNPKRKLRNPLLNLLAALKRSPSQTLGRPKKMK